MANQQTTTNTTQNQPQSTPSMYYKYPSTTIIKDIPFNEREQIVKELYQWILGRQPSISEIDMYIYKDYTLEQVKDMILNLPERINQLQAAKRVPQLRQKIEYLKQEIDKTLWVIRSLQEQVKIKNKIMAHKKAEIKQLRQFIRNLTSHPEGPYAFFETIYKAQYVSLGNKPSKPLELKSTTIQATTATQSTDNLENSEE